MHNNILKLLPICLSLTLGSCSFFDSTPLSPFEQMLQKNQVGSTPMFMGDLPAGNDSYSLGFRQGCSSALSIIGVGGVSTFQNEISLDTNRKSEDPLYHKGWNSGNNYCSYYTDVDPL